MSEQQIDTNFPDYTGEQEAYYAKEPTTFKDIIIRAIEKCRLEGMKEMTKGGEIKDFINGEIIVRTIPNQRKTFTSCVQTLQILLSPHYDKDAEVNIKELEDNLGDIFPAYLEKYVIGETNDFYKDYAEKTGEIHPKAFYYEKVYDEVEEKQTLIYKMIFKELILLFIRQRELSKKRTVAVY